MIGDPQLTDALLEDISGQDALPLLAFTLAHLHKEYRTDNELILAGYVQLGRVNGVIDTAVKVMVPRSGAIGKSQLSRKHQPTAHVALIVNHITHASDFQMTWCMVNGTSLEERCTGH
jgi:hypothetical protein